jgi:hypothetical protein
MMSRKTDCSIFETPSLPSSHVQKRPSGLQTDKQGPAASFPCRMGVQRPSPTRFGRFVHTGAMTSVSAVRGREARRPAPALASRCRCGGWNIFPGAPASHQPRRVMLTRARVTFSGRLPPSSWKSRQDNLPTSCASRAEWNSSSRPGIDPVPCSL